MRGRTLRQGRGSGYPAGGAGRGAGRREIGVLLSDAGFALAERPAEPPVYNPEHTGGFFCRIDGSRADI